MVLAEPKAAAPDGEDEVDLELNFASLLKEGGRPRLLLITGFVGTYDKETEPANFAIIRRVNAAAWQLESGAKGKDHIHIAIELKQRLASISSLMDEIFPKTGAKGKDIRAANPGVSFLTMANYCTKDSHRLDGEAPHRFNVEAQPNPKRKLVEDEIVQQIHAQDCARDLATNGETRGVYQHSPAMTIHIHSERPWKRPAITKGQMLFAWERSLVSLLGRTPQEGDQTVHWMVPAANMKEDEGGEAKEDRPVEGQPFFLRIMRMVRKILAAKKQSKQVEFYSSDHPQEAINNAISAHTKVVFVQNVGDTPISHERLYWLKTAAVAHRSTAGRSDIQELEARHVIVLSLHPPPKKGKHTKACKVWPIDVNKSIWEPERELLACAELQETPFLDFSTIGVSGLLETEAKQMEAATAAVANGAHGN